MNNRFVRVLLLFAALWLPVQTMAALSMPMCRHAQEQAVANDAAATDAHCHEAAMADPPAHDSGCDNCEICHMVSAGFILGASLVAGLVPSENHFVLPPIVAPPSHIAEPPQHPPRSSA